MRALEPLVRHAAVVEREIADELHPAGVHGSRERIECSVAAEQRIDVVEACSVVPVGTAGREERGEVEDVRAERVDVVEPLLDAGQVAAEPLARSVFATALRKLRPLAAHGPLGRLAALTARGESVGKDLVDDR